MRKDSETSFDPSEGPPFRRVLVANRGEIALRIIRACHELGAEAIAIYSDADASAAHVRAADAAVRLGPAPAAESYLRGDAIIDAARRLGAEAIHPGYGFLAERAAFARAVEDAGLIFVGPTSASIAALGDKLAARRLARAAGVPVVPGTLEPAEVDRADAVEAILADADEIGFPLFVKASSGGGGRGMRRVTTREELPAALAAGSAEALAAFGDGAVYLEREVRPARHVEVQLLGDAAGTIVAIGERDCSIQRRHQKLVEESPAPGLSETERRELHEFAVRVARAAELRNAATAEFLLDEDRRFWFLEVNTRIQVEHGVTELASGIDLVREQLLIAAGRPLSQATLDAAERAAAPGRHAIEVRLSAEDPARAFAPVAGRVGRWSMPDGPGVRVDTAIEAGDRIPPDYDSLIAKVLVVDVDRAAAIGRLARVLDEVEVTGIETTLPFHRFVAAHPGFRAAELSTDWVAEHWDPAVAADRGAALDIAARVAMAVAAGGVASGTSGRASGAATGAGPGTGPLDRGERRNGSSGWLRAAREEDVDRWPAG
ncbi:MAG TPA: biotin carboxylase N-terminal domain-containing protein [Methylomirabilota bacterium]|nr:biotin carboxylase N-terminal domain-containing protein [Methylomirabilota bacterium]